MKKVLSTFLVAVLLVSSLFVLASCGLSGTYKDATGTTTLEFSGDNVKITFSLFGVSTTSNAKYSLGENEEGRTITFTYEEGAKENDSLKGTLPFTEGSDDNGSYILIAKVLKFYKQ